MNLTRKTNFRLALLMLLVTCSSACSDRKAAPESTSGGEAEAMAQITGVATYRERMLLPPGATFEAVLEDISIADKAALELGRTTISKVSGPPFAFSIPYAPGIIEENHRYAVRARITVDGQLWFTSDTVHPVLTYDAGSSVEILLRRVGQQPGQKKPPTPEDNIKEGPQ
ncbi:YbaY family lipoprotein [Biformimicrobium ophioploci]|nr:YbaY family lipoprotein [Microbulbifer sp. NKW57]